MNAGAHLDAPLPLSMAARAGIALVLIGLIALVVFVIMLSAGTADLLLLLAGSAVSAFGLLLRRRAARLERREAQRFRTLRHLLGRRSPDNEQDSSNL